MTDFVLGIAGHVDHGKTALTYALTGVETDRLAEEKRRGLTIEPGFAPLPLPSGAIAGLVDVPGHEKFIRNMLSGSAGLDAVLLVVAADDGVMPQTREHLDICALLGVTRGLVVITKRDLVTDERLAQVAGEIRRLTAGTFLADAPVLPLSARTGAGLDELPAAIVRLSQHIPPKNTHQPLRLPVDRVFSKEGFGTVVTGTLIDGSVAVEDTVQLYPDETLARVRGIQSHGAATARLTVGHRAALNLAGVRREDVARGTTVAAPGSLTVTTAVTARLTLLPHAAFSVKTGSLLHLYHGAGEFVCRCTLLGQKILVPGQSCPARLRFDSPLAAREGDRFVVRFFSPMVTIGGGVLTLPVKTEHTPALYEDKAAALLTEYHAKYPLRDGMNREELRSLLNCTPQDFLTLVENGIVKLRGPVAALPAFRPKYTPELARERDRLEVFYRRVGLEPECNKSADKSFDREVIDKLLRDGVLLALGPDYRVHRVLYRRASDALRRLWAQEGVITLASYRDELGISRKYALLLLEKFDRAGMTRKEGDKRILLVDASPTAEL